MSAMRTARAGAWAVGLFWLGSGAWAFLAPRSFYDRAAPFPPYNVHFVHDIGAFMVGLGAVILCALLLTGGTLRVVLTGTGLGAVVHLLSHLADYEIRDTPADLVLPALVAVVTLAAAFAASPAPGRRP